MKSITQSFAVTFIRSWMPLAPLPPRSRLLPPTVERSTKSNQKNPWKHNSEMIHRWRPRLYQELCPLCLLACMTLYDRNQRLISMQCISVLFSFRLQICPPASNMSRLSGPDQNIKTSKLKHLQSMRHFKWHPWSRLSCSALAGGLSSSISVWSVFVSFSSKAQSLLKSVVFRTWQSPLHAKSQGSPMLTSSFWHQWNAKPPYPTLYYTQHWKPVWSSWTFPVWKTNFTPQVTAIRD